MLPNEFAHRRVGFGDYLAENEVEQSESLWGFEPRTQFLRYSVSIIYKLRVLVNRG